MCWCAVDAALDLIIARSATLTIQQNSSLSNAVDLNTVRIWTPCVCVCVCVCVCIKDISSPLCEVTCTVQEFSPSSSKVKWCSVFRACSVLAISHAFMKLSYIYIPRRLHLNTSANRSFNAGITLKFPAAKTQLMKIQITLSCGFTNAGVQCKIVATLHHTVHLHFIISNARMRENIRR